MAWIESHQELARHHKTRRLSRKLGIPAPAVIGHLHCLWWWAVDYAPSGDLSKFETEELAEAAMWWAPDYDNDEVVNATAEEFVQALIDCGWLDRTETGLQLHNWWKYSGRLQETRVIASEAGARGNHKRWHSDRGITDPTCAFCREASGSESGDDRDPTSGATRGDDRGATRGESHSTQPDPTEQNPTGPQKTSHSPPSTGTSTREVDFDGGELRDLFVEERGHHPDDVDAALNALRLRVKGYGTPITDWVAWIAKVLRSMERTRSADPGEAQVIELDDGVRMELVSGSWVEIDRVAP